MMELIKATLLAAVGGGESPDLGTKTVYPDTSDRTYKAEDDNLDGYYQFTVKKTKSEITGTFSQNGEYYPPAGSVWNHVIVSVDVGFETKKRYKDIEDFFDDDPIPHKFEDKNMTWQIKHYSPGEQYTVTFGGEYPGTAPRTVTFSGGGFILFTWLDGKEFKMQDAIWPSGNSYVYEGAKDASVYLNSNNQYQLDVTHVYSNSVTQHHEQIVSMTFPQDITLDVMNDSTGYILTN